MSLNSNKPAEQELIKLYNYDKLSIRQIAEQLGLTWKIIYNLLKKYGLKPRPQGLAARIYHRCPAISAAILQQLYIDKKLSAREIARQYKVTDFWINTKLREYQIPIRSRPKNPPREPKPCAVCDRLTTNKTFCSLFCAHSPIGRKLSSSKIRATVLALPEEVFNERIRKAARRPNKYEKLLDSFLQENFPNQWKYVGDGTFIIGRKNPDFVNINGKKLLIELWGEYWHKGENPQDRIDIFSRYGFNTLIIWAKELKYPKALKDRVTNLGKEVFQSYA